MFNDFYSVAKRIKRKHLEDKVYFPKRFKVPKEGYEYTVSELETPQEGIVFLVPEEEEYFTPLSQEIYFSLEEEEEEYELLPDQVLKLLENPVELHKAADIIDRVHGVKPLKNPDRWCVFPESETVEIEIPLTKYVNERYEELVIQEIGHVSWYKAVFHVDKRVYEESLTGVHIKQVIRKVETRGLPRWKAPARHWDQDFKGIIEVPGTIFCSEQALIKKVHKYFRRQGYTPEIVHTKDISRTDRDNIGCSVLRRHQPPHWSYTPIPRGEEEEKAWNGLECRNQWVFQSLYTIWAGEAAVPDSEYRERVYYAGPEKHFNRDEYFNEVYNCYAEPSCQVIPDVEEVEEEPLEVYTEDEDEEVW